MGICVPIIVSSLFPFIVDGMRLFLTHLRLFGGCRMELQGMLWVSGFF